MFRIDCLRALQGTAAVQGESVNRGGSGAGSSPSRLAPWRCAPTAACGVPATSSLRRERSATRPSTPGARRSAGAGFVPAAMWASHSTSMTQSTECPAASSADTRTASMSRRIGDTWRPPASAHSGAGRASSTGWKSRALTRRYFHRELESSGVCGVSFGLLTTSGTALLRFRGPAGSRGFAGFVGEHRDYANGCLSFIPPTTERTLAGFAYDEVEVGRFRFAGSLRMDDRVVEPAEPDSNKAGLIRRRSFGGVSGGFMVSGPITPTWGASASIMRSFHPPAIEELFSDGPHLAAYSYEVGNADLDAETRHRARVWNPACRRATADRSNGLSQCVRRIHLPDQHRRARVWPGGDGSAGALPVRRSRRAHDRRRASARVGFHLGG